MGLSTPRHDDDTYIITGSGSVTNAAGESRASEIIEAMRSRFADVERLLQVAITVTDEFHVGLEGVCGA